jgi:hypothetical protein
MSDAKDKGCAMIYRVNIVLVDRFPALALTRVTA